LTLSGPRRWQIVGFRYCTVQEEYAEIALAILLAIAHNEVLWLLACRPIEGSTHSSPPRTDARFESKEIPTC
jgi:hypothetical protein